MPCIKARGFMSERRHSFPALHAGFYFVSGFMREPTNCIHDGSWSMKPICSMFPLVSEHSWCKSALMMHSGLFRDHYQGWVFFLKYHLIASQVKCATTSHTPDLLLSFFPLVQDEINCERIRHYFIDFFVINLYLTVRISTLNSKDNWCN